MVTFKVFNAIQELSTANCDCDCVMPYTKEFDLNLNLRYVVGTT